MKSRVLATAALAALAVCVTVTLIEGRPRHLPGVALGSPVLLHAERALALVAVTVAMLSIGVQATRGRLPIELSTSGLRYEPRQPIAPRPRSRSCRSSTTICWPSSTSSQIASTPRNDVPNL
jgi:hypothetical protein